MNKSHSARASRKASMVFLAAVSFPSLVFSGPQFTAVTTGNFAPTSQQPTRSWGNPIWGNINSNTDNTNPKLDLIIPTNSSLPLVYVNNGSDSFTLIPNGTANGQSGIYLPTGYDNLADWRGFAFGDYDGDGKLDLFIAINAATGSKSNLLFKGTGGPTSTTPAPYFTWVSGDLVLNGDSQEGQSGFWVDSDKDGKLELFIKNYFADQAHALTGANRLNEWSGTVFTNIIGAGSNLELAVHQDFNMQYPDGHGVICSFTDTRYNGDMNVAFSSFRKAFYYKDGTGYKELTDLTGKSIVPIDGEICLGVAWGDYNNDSYPDLYIASGTLNSSQCDPSLPSCLRTYLFKNNGDNTFTDFTTLAGVYTEANTWSPIWGDYDNDGYLDLFVTCSDDAAGTGTDKNSNFFWRNSGPPGYTFTPVTESAVQMNDGHSLHKTAAWADYNNDGFLDLVVKDGIGGTMDTAKLVKNNANNNNHWIEVYLHGQGPMSNGSNINGIGARVTVTYTPTLGGMRTAYRVNNGGGGGEYGSQGSEPLHFGLKDAISATVTVLWPNGRHNDAVPVSAGTIVTIPEPGS